MNLKLAYDLQFDDLYSDEGQRKIDDLFLGLLQSKFPELLHKLVSMRTNPELINKKEESAFIILLAPVLEQFIGELFGINQSISALANMHTELAPIFKVKKLFIQREVAKLAPNDIDVLQVETKLEAFGIDLTSELSFASHISEWMDGKDGEKLKVARDYSVWALHAEAAQSLRKEWSLFKLPKKTILEQLIPLERNAENGICSSHVRTRDGFSLTDEGYSLTKALDQANYCIKCHNQGKDSCSIGLKDPDTNFYKKNELNINLAGCPLEEKISEMNLLKAEGSIVGAFATALIDNPMIAATGHRICNDCMKACIYQKQEPVNIPMIETQILKDVLLLPWGFEIYSLLIKWNPLSIRNYLPKMPNSKKVLIAGMGPAGFTLAHYLLNMGYTVLGIDGLKIEPFNDVFQPIYDIETELFEDLGTRKAYGFGGVAEYGITVRWDKNYLTVIRLLLERRANFKLKGGIRLGSNLSIDDAFGIGFDHIALCMGAGRPNLLNIPNGFAKGVRTASDFLMTLQSSGAMFKNSITNFDIRLPIVVIGGGLTAIDTATESLAYYKLQVERFLKRYELLGEGVLQNLSAEEKLIKEEYLTHARALRDTSKTSHLMLIKSWGGVKVAYRKKIQNAPAYRLNHEEIEKALEEGIEFHEMLDPKEILLDEHGTASAVRFDNAILPARTVLIAAGTKPNTILQVEEKEYIDLDGEFFAAKDSFGNIVKPERISKPSAVEVVVYNDGKNSISFFGDLHPSFAGNVVKAMGSAKQGYPIIDKLLSVKNPNSIQPRNDFFAQLDAELTAKVTRIERLTPTIVEVIIKAPLAAKRFKPGQFYRLQNFQNTTKLGMEGLALTGAWVDKEKSLVSLIVLEMGGSSNLCAKLDVGEEVVLMGPAGEPTEIKANETVALVGGGLGNAVLLSIGKAFREAGSKVLFFAGYKKQIDRYKISRIEAAADQVVWCCDEVLLPKSRAQDLTFKGNIVNGIKAYAKGEIGKAMITLQDVDRIIAIGSDKMMSAVAYNRHHDLKEFLKPNHIAIGSINSPMQCMMKEICGQCIQRHVDPVTQQESYVYSCKNQDQNLDEVDFEHLAARLAQNSLQEKLTACWISSQKNPSNY